MTMQLAADDIYIYIYTQSIDLFHDSSRFLHQIFDFISRLHQGDCVASTVTHRSIADTKI